MAPPVNQRSQHLSSSGAIGAALAQRYPHHTLSHSTVIDTRSRAVLLLWPTFEQCCCYSPELNQGRGGDRWKDAERSRCRSPHSRTGSLLRSVCLLFAARSDLVNTCDRSR